MVMADALVAEQSLGREQSLARDMIEVHGMDAATVARNNARGAALAGQAVQAKSWIRVLGIIQSALVGRASAVRAAGNRPNTIAGSRP
jgi:hypothetical protein